MLQKTSLHQEHLNLKAKMVPFSGWEMPIQYSSLKDEVIAVRNNVGLFDVSHMGEFFIEGNDAEKFINFLVTNNIQGAPYGKAVYSPLCRDNGTVIDDLIVYKLQPGKILVCVNASNIEKDWQWIKSHTNNFEVNLSNRSQDFSLIALQGPMSEKILKNLIPELNELTYYGVQEIGSNFIVARTGYTGEDGFEIFATHEKILQLWRACIELGAVPCGLGARDVLRLEVCYPLYGHELSDEVTPLDAGLKWTVKLDKENFIGKNSLASLKPKYKLVKFTCAKGIPREKYLIKDSNGAQIGVVTSGTMSVTLGHGIAMALVDAELFNANERYFVEIRQKDYDLEITNKAFVQGGHK